MFECCYECKLRQVACHATCKDYLADKEINDKRLEEQHREAMIRDRQVQGHMNMHRISNTNGVTSMPKYTRKKDR